MRKANLSLPGFLSRPRADYAADPARSRGRLIAEEASATRSDFQRDRDRIIHSTAFRRLKHKTQVFIEHEGDHFRTRLTHTIEVAQIARSIARALGIDEDLAEALALAHDLGHTPFGHTGEDALDECMRGYGGFDHNAQALRIVTRLERRYAAFDGLNLTWETLEGLVKHNGPLLLPDGAPVEKYAGSGVPGAILEYDTVSTLELSLYASAEAQAAAIADDIAYDAHDIDDGLRAGLFQLDELKEIPWFAGALSEINERWPGLDRSRIIHEIGRRLITQFVEAVIRAAAVQIARLNPQSAGDVRRAGEALIAMPPEMAAVDQGIKSFLYPHVYRHPVMMRERARAARIVRDLYAALFNAPELMPEEWRLAPSAGEARRARRVSDYIAGMTDRFAMQEHAKLFGGAAQAR